MLEERIKHARRGVHLACVSQGITREEDSQRGSSNITDVGDPNNKFTAKEDEILQRNVIDTGDKGIRMAEETDDLKLTQIKLHNELIFRRQYMINSIQRLLFPSSTENGSTQYNLFINSKPLQNGERAAITLRDLVKIHGKLRIFELDIISSCR